MLVEVDRIDGRGRGQCSSDRPFQADLMRTGSERDANDNRPAFNTHCASCRLCDDRSRTRRNRDSVDRYTNADSRLTCGIDTCREAPFDDGEVRACGRNDVRADQVGEDAVRFGCRYEEAITRGSEHTLTAAGSGGTKRSGGSRDTAWTCGSCGAESSRARRSGRTGGALLVAADSAAGATAPAVVTIPVMHDRLSF